MIEFRCNNCGRKLSIPESNAGKKGRCPKCKSIVFIPGAQKPDSPPLQENSDGPKDGPRYSAFDLTLLELPKIGEAREKQTGESDKAGEPKDSITQTPEQSDEELVVERKFPWPIDIFLYPASRSGLVILGTIIAIRWFSIIVVRSIGFATPALSPMIVFVVPLICISIIVRVVLYVFFYWYLCECIRDSAEGGIRAPETTHKTPGLWELLWLLRSVVCFVIFAGPVMAYYFSTGRADTVFWLWLAFGVLLLPISFLAFVMFDSLTSAFNPFLLVGSIRSTFLPYCAMVLVFLTAGFFIITITQDMDFTLVQEFIIHCAVMYLLMVTAHILGGFYNRYRAQLNWDV